MHPIPSITDLEARIAQVLTDWNVVGGSVAILKDGEVFSARGYGLKEYGKAELVDENTLFGIGSNTKSFTAAGIALLVDEGKLTWDDAVVRFLPDFQMVDPWVTRQITVRDLLCHRSGWGRSLRILYNRNYDLAELVRRVRYFPLVKNFRDEFGYTNFHYMVAGRIIEVLSGKTWSEFMRERIFTPLGMLSSAADLPQMQCKSNSSAAHSDTRDLPLPHGSRMFTQTALVPWMDVGNQPAGGINSSALDLVQWMKCMLADGKYKDLQLIQPETLRAMHSPCSTFKNPLHSDLGFLVAFNAEIQFYSCGLGWFVLDYKGSKFVFHAGQIVGFNSIVALFPQHRLGFAILLNADTTFAHVALMLMIADAFLGGSQRDWGAELKSLAQTLIQQDEEAVAKRYAERKDLLPSLSLQHYVGTYENDFMGSTEVRLDADHLVMQYGTHHLGEMVHWEADTFTVNWQDKCMDWSFVTFQLSESGSVSALSVDQEGEYRRVSEEIKQ